MDLSSSSTNSEELPRQLLSLPDAHDGHFEVFVGKEDFKVCSCRSHVAPATTHTYASVNHRFSTLPLGRSLTRPTS